MQRVHARCGRVSMRTSRSSRNKDSGERCLFLSLSISFSRSLSSSLFRSVNLYAICTKIIIRVARSRSLINYCPPEGSSHWQVEGTVYSLSCVTYIATTVKKSKNRSISKIYRLFFFLSFSLDRITRFCVTLRRFIRHESRVHVRRLERHNRL